MLSTLLIGLGGVTLSCLGFLLGKVFAQSEKILEWKRKTYKDFLELCPAPNEAHFELPLGQSEFQKQIGLLTLYASPDVVKFASEYFVVLANTNETLMGVTEPNHPEFLKVMTTYNRMVWAMRVDAMTWSIFSPVKQARQYKPSVERSRTE